MINNRDHLIRLKESISKEKKIISEIISLSESLEKANIEERKIILSQISSLKNFLKRINQEIPTILEKISITKPLSPKIESQTEKKTEKKDIKQPIKIKKISLKGKVKKRIGLSKLEKSTLKRLKKKKGKIIKKKRKKPSMYVKTANKIFFNFSVPLSNKEIFRTMNRNLIKTNLQFVPAAYMSTMLFTTLLSIFLAIFVFVFFLFFNFGATLPIITRVTEDISTRFIKVFWLLFVMPIGTFLLMFFYPSMEKKSLENKINQELPFATIHMSAISGSMIDPSQIFSIIISTKEYPYLEKEFTKLINEINIYGYDLVSALRNVAFNNPSRKLSELFNGLATTITSGGDLSEFFDKRSQSLLFEHRLEKEKYIKSAETFMDIYISVVIAAPMILMLLIIMIKISGLGISLSTSMITLVMVLGVSMINVLFLTFLHLKQPSG